MHERFAPLMITLEKKIYCRIPWTCLKLSSVVGTIVGTILTVQPQIIFGSASEEHDIHEKYPQYSLGVTTAVAAAILGSFADIIIPLAKDMPKSYFLGISGVICFIMAIISPLVRVPNPSLNYFHQKVPSRSSGQLWTLVCVVCSAPITRLLTLIALQNAPPTLVSVVRCTEVPKSMIFDLIMARIPLDPTSSFFCRIGGSILVSLSAILMATSDWAETKLCFKSTARNKVKKSTPDITVS